MVFTGGLVNVYETYSGPLSIRRLPYHGTLPMVIFIILYNFFVKYPSSDVNTPSDFQHIALQPIYSE
jgi:hypothetical protein